MRIEIEDTLTVSGIETERLEDILTRSGEWTCLDRSYATSDFLVSWGIFLILVRFSKN